MRQTFLPALFLILYSSCSTHHKNSKKRHPKESNVTIVENFQGHRWSNIYFSGQPNQKSIKSLKQEGFSAVINLRQTSESNYSEKWEKDLVMKQGLAYYHHPFNMSSELTDDYINQVTKSIVKNRKKGKVLVHCSSGNRVGVWLGAHFKKDHGFSNQESLKLAEELGLQKAAAINKLKSYLEVRE